MYEYKFVTIPRKMGLNGGHAAEQIQEAVTQAALEGWRLSQVVTTFNENIGMYSPDGYQIIFEREAPV